MTVRQNLPRHTASHRTALIGQQHLVHSLNKGRDVKRNEEKPAVFIRSIKIPGITTRFAVDRNRRLRLKAHIILYFDDKDNIRTGRPPNAAAAPPDLISPAQLALLV